MILAFATVVVVLLAGAYCFLSADGCHPVSLLLTPDQRGQIRFNKAHYEPAAETFSDPMWRAAAWYRAGEFKKAAGIFAGSDTAEGAYNHGNALAMQGKYEAAIPRYERALFFRPDWQDAQINLAIARQSAEKLKRKGGEGTGGKLGADGIVFSKDPSKDRLGGDETVDGATEMSDAEMRAMWLRRVQTKPADFLKAKFAYQNAMQEEKE
jgi:Ca-activated chloride channel family protein